MPPEGARGVLAGRDGNLPHNEAGCGFKRNIWYRESTRCRACYGGDWRESDGSRPIAPGKCNPSAGKSDLKHLVSTR